MTDFIQVLTRLYRLSAAQNQSQSQLSQPSAYSASRMKREEFKVAIELFGYREDELSPVYSAQTLSTIKSALTTAYEDASVRESAINAIGSIGLPWVEGFQALTIKAMKDEEPKVRAMAAWALGKVGPRFVDRKGLDGLINLLKDSFWKVKTTACITLGLLGPGYIDKALEVLLEALRTGSINRVIVSESVVKLGPPGERILVEILKRMRVKDAKLICPIIASLELADISQPSADFVFEELFNCASSGTPQIKKAAVETLYRLKLRLREGDEVPIYLTFESTKTLLEKGLKDQYADYRELCLNFIMSYETHNTDYLLQAATGASETSVRCEAMKGLSKFGCRFLNVLLYGLSDSSEFVRAISRSYLEHNFDIQEFTEMYTEPGMGTQLEELREIVAGLDGGQMEGPGVEKAIRSLEIAINDLL